MQYKNTFDNHLVFLASHRGSVIRQGDHCIIASEQPEFSYVVLGPSTGYPAPLDSAKLVQLVPWSGNSSSELCDFGFAKAYGLSYMVLNGGVSGWQVRTDVKIERVEDMEAMLTFSEVQCRGFNESAEGYARWHHWLRDANLRNLTNRDQAFYVGRIGTEPAGVVLTLKSANTVGIYAVATLPKFRKTGIATTMMRAAIETAHRDGCSLICLQVKEDSSVESFYRQLGFERVFTTAMYQRK